MRRRYGTFDSSTGEMSRWISMDILSRCHQPCVTRESVGLSLVTNGEASRLYLSAWCLFDEAQPPSVSMSLCTLPFIVVRRERAVTHNHGCISERMIDNGQRSHRTGTHDAEQILIRIAWPIGQNGKTRRRALLHHGWMTRHISHSTKGALPSDTTFRLRLQNYGS